MLIDYLLIGQGICGSFLSWYLQKENKSFVVVDRNDAVTPSKISGGIINPVTGRRMVKVWMAEDVIPFAARAYHEWGQELGTVTISQKNIIDFFPNPHQRVVFMERIDEGGPYLHSFPEQNHFNPYFNYELGCGEIRGSYIVHLGNILPHWRKKLESNNQLLEEEFDFSKLIVENDSVRYKDVQASKIIFCDGAGGFGNPYFKQLPFAPNKGEVVIVEIPGLPDQYIYKRGFLLVPLATKDLFWLGSNYQWEFDNADPSKDFYDQAQRHLSSWLQMPFKILEHKAGLRPATLERRPFVGLHPHHKNIGILNGMGTKGCSLAPYFAKQLVTYLTKNEPVDPLADVNRFQRILRDY